MSLPRNELSDVLARLYARVPLGMRLGLEPMRAAGAKAGSPETRLSAVHVAGTNGKGSTSAMVEAMARASGKRTGLYTSPHLARFAERIRIDGEPISDDELVDVLGRALDIGAELSFFETATLAAFMAFAERGVEVAVVEVGIGGRLDATNVLPAEAVTCAAVTRIALDHQDRLGTTIEEIAREKLAIGKRGRPIVLGPNVPDLPTEGRVVRARAIGGDVAVGMVGEHQRENAGVAWAIAEEVGIDKDARRAGLASARWPGRFERIDGFVLDGAHNPDGIRALVQTLRGEDVGAVVFGALADKDWRAMLSALDAVDAPRFFAAPHGRPAALLDGATSLDEALAAARRVAGSRTVVICGSIYLVGEARAKLLGLPSDPPVAL